MNSDTVTQLLQKGFHVTIGATASLVESLQDPQKREQNFSRLRSEFSELTTPSLVESLQDPNRREQNLIRLRLELDELTQEWAQKGEVTEREARAFVDTMLAQRNQGTSSTTTVTTTATPVSTISPEVQLELQALTAQLGAIRAELERLRSEEEMRDEG
ncbi:hypothetical protein ACKFKF_00600 [Phormidesmis sp. 146-12]